MSHGRNAEAQKTCQHELTFVLSASAACSVSTRRTALAPGPASLAFGIFSNILNILNVKSSCTAAKLWMVVVQRACGQTRWMGRNTRAPLAVQTCFTHNIPIKLRHAKCYWSCVAVVHVRARGRRKANLANPKRSDVRTQHLE